MRRSKRLRAQKTRHGWPRTSWRGSTRQRRKRKYTSNPRHSLIARDVIEMMLVPGLGRCRSGGKRFGRGRSCIIYTPRAGGSKGIAHTRSTRS